MGINVPVILFMYAIEYFRSFIAPSGKKQLLIPGDNEEYHFYRLPALLIYFNSRSAIKAQASFPLTFSLSPRNLK